VTEHLPECTLDTQVNDWCICDRLRAAQQRGDQLEDVYWRGRERGLQDAVAAVEPLWIQSDNVDVVVALEQAANAIKGCSGSLAPTERQQRK